MMFTAPPYSATSHKHYNLNCSMSRYPSIANCHISCNSFPTAGKSLIKVGGQVVFFTWLFTNPTKARALIPQNTTP